MYAVSATLRAGLAVVALVATTSSALADEVHLESGRSIEGKATAQGDKVVIALESGQIAISRGDVARIDNRTAPLVEAERREAKLAAGDRAGLLQLADFCREHGLGAKERDLLQRLLVLEPDHEAARRRLGFVRTDKGWAPRRELAIREATQRRDRERAELELRQKRAELALTEAKLAREKAPPTPPPEPAEVAAPPPVYAPLLVAPYYPGPAVMPFAPPYPAPPSMSPPNVQQPVFPINGVRHPSAVIDEAFRRHMPSR